VVAAVKPGETIEQQPYRLDPGSGDHERFAHYVRRSGQKGATQRIMESMLSGTPIEALCGKRWVPSRDPERFPVCPECKAIHDEIRSRGSDG